MKCVCAWTCAGGGGGGGPGGREGRGRGGAVTLAEEGEFHG